MLCGEFVSYSLPPVRPWDLAFSLEGGKYELDRRHVFGRKPCGV